MGNHWRVFGRSGVKNIKKNLNEGKLGYHIRGFFRGAGER